MTNSLGTRLRFLAPILLSAGISLSSAAREVTVAREIPAHRLVVRATLEAGSAAWRGPKAGARAWGTEVGRRYRAPCLKALLVEFRGQKYRVPSYLLEGLGSLHAGEPDAAPEACRVTESNGWFEITMPGSDGASAYVASWRLAFWSGLCVLVVGPQGVYATEDGPGHPEVRTGYLVRVKTGAEMHPDAAVESAPKIKQRRVNRRYGDTTTR